MSYLDKTDKEVEAMRARIFVLLKECKISQKDFAQVIGVSPQTVTDWKKKKSNSFLGMISSISDVLQTTPVWLLFGIGHKHMSDEEKQKQENLQLQASMCELNRYKKETAQIIKAAFNNMNEKGFLPEIELEYPHLVDTLSNYLEIDPSELRGEPERTGQGEKKEPATISVSQPDLLIKFNSLSPDDQEEVLAIIDLKLARRAPEK